ncbi:hypothetical protein D3C80_2135320 [compost metagenome]
MAAPGGSVGKPGICRAGNGPVALLSVVSTYIKSPDRTKRSYRPQILTNPPKLRSSMTSENDFST